MLSAQWAANLWVLLDLPFIYFGEYVVNLASPTAGHSSTGLSAFHEFGWLIADGYNVTARYDWADANAELASDTRHRASLGLEFYPVQFLEVIFRYRHNWSFGDERFSSAADELLVMLHGWY